MPQVEYVVGVLLRDGKKAATFGVLLPGMHLLM
jgi:hypothetical protein